MKLGNKVKIFIFSFLFVFSTIVNSAGTKTEIYSKLKCCPCKKEFVSCACPNAREMKAYIEALLDVGLNKDDILVKVAKKYSLEAIIDEEMRGFIESKLIEEAGETRPNIFISPLSYDLGIISKSVGKLELKVVVRNTGNAPLTIHDLRTSCECTTVRLKTEGSLTSPFSIKGAGPEWKMDIEQGQKAELIIVTDLNHPHVRLGRMVRGVAIESNDPIHPLVRIELEAEIVK